MTGEAIAAAPARAPRLSEIRPGLYQFFGPKPSAHVYLLRGSRKNVLIDCGLPAAFPALAEGLAELELAPRDIHMVVLTHEHIDHVGAAPCFFEHAVVAAHRLAANKILLQDEFALMNKAFGLSASVFRVDLCIDGGEMLDLGAYRLRILHTPGHSSGSICLHEPDQGLLFTADTVMAGGVMGGIFGSGNISDYIASLENLATLKASMLLPGHGRLSETPDADIAKALERARTLLEQTRQLFDTLDVTHTFEHILRAARNLNI